MKTILIADDEEGRQLLIATTLEGQDSGPLETGNGSRALELVRRERPNLIVLDWIMPSMTGIEVLQELRKDASIGTIPVILLTAKGQEKDKSVGPSSGAQGCLAKPFSPLQLLKQIQEVLEQARSVLKAQFDGVGLSVLVTAYAEEGLQLARPSQPQLILLDIYLAGQLCGWDLQVAIQADELLQQIPVVVVTIAEPNVRGLALDGADYLVKSASAEVLMSSIRRKLPHLKGKHVLVADDDPVFRQVLTNSLLAEGNLEVEKAANGKEALDALARKMPDLLVLDLIMPEMDGFEVLQRLRANSRTVDLPVLITAKDLSSEQNTYIGRSLASLVGKKEADLNYITGVVGRALGVNLATGVAASAAP